MSSQNISKHPVLTNAFLKGVATGPGVYLMKDSKKRVIYVGKARNLRKRLTSYARLQAQAHNKTKALVAKIAAVETILTATEKEALILEASLIKKNKPKYNVILRDDKNYPFIKVTVQDKWPRLMMTRRRLKDKARYFGPYSSVSSMWAAIKLLGNLFPLRRCKVVRPRKRPCLNGQMGACLAPCVPGCDERMYMQAVDNVIMVLEGKSQELLKRLREKMTVASGNLDFEEAALCRDQITSLEKTLEKQVMVASSSHDIDVFGVQRQAGSMAISVITVRSGKVEGHQSFFIAEPVGDDHDVLAEALRRFYSDDIYIPKLVLLPWSTGEEAFFEEYLTDQKSGKVTMRIPQKGDLRRLVAMANENAAQVFSDRDKQEKSWQVMARQLKETLNLSRLPRRIECLDISNTSGKEAVGSLVCFVDGEKAATHYRHYKIRSVAGPDDYAMMAEVLCRRFAPEKGPELPDLFIVDGGKGQLNIGVKIFKDLAIFNEVDLLGIAKERQGEGEKLFRPGRKNPYQLARHSQLLLFVMRIRDESHRYGVTFHRKLRKKRTLTSELDHVVGIGPARRKRLLSHFGSVAGVKKASLEELASVDTVGKELAQTIFHALHRQG
ncbi:MAG: excinuclease ABC subunit UvrC [Thermodesulfobacteriota bacterium]